MFPDLDAIEEAEEERVAKVTRDVFRRNTHKKIVDDGLKRQALTKKSVRTTLGVSWGFVVLTRFFFFFSAQKIRDEDDNADTRPMSSASTAQPAQPPKTKVAKKRPRVQEAPPLQPSLNARQVQQQQEQDRQYQHFQHLLQQQKMQHQSQQQLAEQASGGKRRAPAAAAAAAARRTYIHHPAGQKTKLIELLVRCGSELDHVPLLADFNGNGRYLCLPANTSVQQLRKFLAARCSIEQDDLHLVLVSGMPVDDRITIARLEEYWVERGPAVVEIRLMSLAAKTSHSSKSATTTTTTNHAAADTNSSDKGNAASTTAATTTNHTSSND